MLFSVFKKYPLGFEELFFTQTFFNFSFYGLKSLFILYVIAQFSLSEREAIHLFATLMTLSYAASLIGGWIADNRLGTKNTIILGSFLQASGIFVLLFPSENLCFFALALICLGAGFVKPNLSTSVGMLFNNPKDPQKDKAYSTFYIAMNLGSFIAPLLCGLVSKMYGGYYNGLLLIIMVLIGGAYLFYKKVKLKQRTDPISFINSLFPDSAFVGVCLSSFIFFFYLLFKYHEVFEHLIGVIALGSFIYLGKIFYKSNSQEKKDILNIIFYIFLFTFFCSLFEQAGSSLLLFFDKAVDRHIMGIELPSSALLSLGPIFVLICSPLLIIFSEKLFEKKAEINGLIKLGIGFLLISLSFLILALSCNTDKDLVSLSWIVGALLIQTIGELLIVPIGFSNVSKLSPPRFRSLMMSFWLMAIAYGNYFAGFIAQFSLSSFSAHENSLEHYRTFFSNLSLLPCIVGVFLLFYYLIKQSRLFLKKPSELC